MGFVWFIEMIWSYHEEDVINIHYLSPKYRIISPEKLLFCESLKFLPLFFRFFSKNYVFMVNRHHESVFA